MEALWKPPRIAAYVALNGVFIVTTLALATIGGSGSPRIAHLILLFAVCSHWIIDVDGLNGRFALLALYLSFYFVSFGLVDFTNLLGKGSSEVASLFSATEAVILVGAIAITVGYRVALALAGSRPPAAASVRDWPTNAALTVGILMWSIGIGSMFVWGVYIVNDTTIEAAKKGLSSISPVAVAAYLLAGLLQPFGVLLIAYVWRTKKSRLLLPLVIAIVVLQVLLGFVLNIKSLAMTAGILVIVTSVLIDGRLPKAWIAGAIVFGMVAFPIFQASREEVHGNRHIARTKIVENLGAVLGLAIAAEDKVTKGPERAQTLLERTSVRGSLEMIVQRTGIDVPFQHGYTLTPLYSSFIPRLLWPDKPDVPTGRLVNKLFHLSEYEDTYISPSIPGELYWNFGWSGVLLGMALIGAALGYLCNRFNLARARTVTGLLVIVITIKQAIVGLEGTFAPEYVIWFRSLGAVAVLHWLFARVPVSRRVTTAVDASLVAAGATASERPFPNLLT